MFLQNLLWDRGILEVRVLLLSVSSKKLLQVVRFTGLTSLVESLSQDASQNPLLVFKRFSSPTTFPSDPSLLSYPVPSLHPSLYRGHTTPGKFFKSYLTSFCKFLASSLRRTLVVPLQHARTGGYKIRPLYYSSTLNTRVCTDLLLRVSSSSLRVSLDFSDVSGVTLVTLLSRVEGRHWKWVSVPVLQIECRKVVPSFKKRTYSRR